MKIFHKKWTVGYGDKQSSFWMRKNAQAYADEMNVWSYQYFGGEIFEVRNEY